MIIFDHPKSDLGRWWTLPEDYRDRILSYVKSQLPEGRINGVYGMRLEVIDLPVLFTEEAVRVNGKIQYHPHQNTPNCIDVLCEDKMYAVKELPSWI